MIHLTDYQSNNKKSLDKYPFEEEKNTRGRERRKLYYWRFQSHDDIYVSCKNCRPIVDM